MSKITDVGLTRSGTSCFIAVPMWQQWASKGYIIIAIYKSTLLYFYSDYGSESLEVYFVSTVS